MSQLTKIERAAKRQALTAEVSPSATPKEELRLRVREYINLVRGMVAAEHQFKPRKFKATGEVREPGLPAQSQARYVALYKDLKKDKAVVAARIARVLKEIPLWNLWLKNVAGIGPIVGAFLIAFIDFTKCRTPSALRLYCGNSPDKNTGRLQKAVSGETRAYNPHLRVVLYLASGSMTKESRNFTRASAPLARTSKYVQLWEDAWMRALASEQHRPETNEWCDRDGNWHKGARAWALKKGRAKAFDLFLEDLYMVGRALAGQPIWKTYYTAKLGFEHGGKPVEDMRPVTISVEEAIAICGEVGWVPRTVAIPAAIRKTKEADAEAAVDDDDGETDVMAEDDAVEVAAE